MGHPPGARAPRPPRRPRRTLGPGFPVMPRGPLSPRGPWTDGERGKVGPDPRPRLPGTATPAPGRAPVTGSRVQKEALHPKAGYRGASLSPRSWLPRCALEQRRGRLVSHPRSARHRLSPPLPGEEEAGRHQESGRTPCVSHRRFSGGGRSWPLTHRASGSRTGLAVRFPPVVCRVPPQTSGF